MRAIYFSAQHAAFREQVKSFLSEHVLPFAEQWETSRLVPHNAWKAFAEHGYLGLAHAARHGGQERDFFYSIAFLEELGRTGYGGMRAAISLHAYMATHYLAKYASDALQDAYLRPSIRGEKIAALAITEWEAGSDLSRLTTQAREDGDTLVIDGGKAFITNGTIADYFIVALRTSPPDPGAKRSNTGISLVVVDAKTPGIAITSQEKLGWHSAGTAEIRFDAVRVPAANVVGRLNSGFLYLMKGFQLERLVAAALAVGGTERALATTLEHLQKREAFNSRLSDLQSIRHRIADLAAELASTRLLTYHAAWCYERDALSVTECSMAKLQATELACRAADLCLQLQGAKGYLATSDISRMHRDARAGSLAGGSSEIMREIVAQQLIDMGGGD